MSPVPPIKRPRLNNRSRGQVMVIFVAAILTFVGLCAIVVDVSWYWANTLRAQRAADAAALAGAVYLPVDSGSAFAEAQKAAVRNGYTNGVNGVKVIPFIDADDPRQLDVRVEGQVQSFFAQVFGIKGWPVSRTGEGVYIQPVPMGSPDAYYGVGDFWTNVTTTSTSSQSAITNLQVPDDTAPTGGTWSFNAGFRKTITTVVEGNDNDYAFTNTTNAKQQWTNFGLATNGGSPVPNPAANQTIAIRGIEVDLNDIFLTQACSFGGSAKVQFELSWDGGGTWSTPQSTNNLNTTTSTDFVFGNTTSNTGWGTGNAGWGAHNWVRNDLTDGNFRVRATFLNTACGNRTVDLDQVSARVGYTLTTTTTTVTLTKQTVKDLNGNVLASRGAWGAMLTKGGNHENGDAYGPANNGGSANADYDPDGYDYIVNLPAGGTISVFDPGFCAMGEIDAGSIGTGDHWVGTQGTPVSTYFTLKDTGGKPGLPTTWNTLYTSGSLFQNQRGYDPDNQSGDPPTGATSGCDPNHDKWWTFPVGNLAAGQYAIKVQTTSDTNGTINSGTNAENMFAFLAQGGGSPQIFGNGRMAVYNNLRAGVPNQQFYLAQVDKQTGLNKTMLLDIFDPGDVAGEATLQILSPSGGSQNVVKFNYTTDGNCQQGVSDNCSGTNVTQLDTADNGRSSFNNTWIHISIPLTNYGTGGLWENGWWQIRYQTPDGGNDTTTWQVNIQGNPVHLVVP